ncbi:hypothetical protein CE91St56_26150 [Lachnospiraceae bacterium]|nr:hypothetical protein CE91St56_26150 [Lachnospiraceae bacterium]GKH41560.1 hypothetical protein CE91St57_25340 [Lachnospiraceae bacterium]
MPSGFLRVSGGHAPNRYLQGRRENSGQLFFGGSLLFYLGILTGFCYTGCRNGFAFEKLFLILCKEVIYESCI